MLINERTSFCPILIDRIKLKQHEVQGWLTKHEVTKELPLYSSVDIRDAGFKIAVVDTNIFPAGFNNLCEHGLTDSISLLRQAIERRVPGCRDILIIAEEHTRNTWYLENIRILQQIIRDAGFNARIATFLTIQPAFCDNANHVELETATGQPVEIYCLNKLLSNYKAGIENFDLIILNNDLTTGIPDVLLNSEIPIYPSIQAGWHSRLKSHHFEHTNNLVSEFAEIVGLDPWFFSAIYSSVDDADINKHDDQVRLMDAASDLFKKITMKYKEHFIEEKPYLMIKSDSGTYGMGVLPIENPEDIVHLSRKNRNKLHVGKSSKIIHRYLLQEGIPTIYNIDRQASEFCIYQIENNLVGGFYRLHPDKGQRENLNSKGMGFQKMCPHVKKYGDCGVHHNINIFDIYRYLARIAAVAAHREIIELEDRRK